MTVSTDHLAASFGAAPAGLDAVLHISEFFAVGRALVANLGAFLAKMLCVFGIHQHEVAEVRQISAHAVISRKCFGSVCLPPFSRQCVIAMPKQD